ncbi:hypothetical protein DPMN_127822 [Dreissena polymorpha]|uniref:Uncharacterized protein n=1 Tax=Dreissena polymorpha TaxID=45954 RepID=A0A9D4JV66_DREPO|nr:hypothetical protein DPMN_127822 [Dreissena polymorpha]
MSVITCCDWLPTLYEAAGGDPTKMADLDSSSEWKSLSHNQPGNRQEILRNIDPCLKGHMALRVGDYKILFGDYWMIWSDWYPPWTSPGDSVELHVNNRPYSNISLPGIRICSFLM